ncbi:MAG TPA: rhodanese-like domain-containing protein [Thermoplasmata archaeon]|nr:rhodanese-like domain-containing protein [Thermoplasmata archaeon]
MASLKPEEVAERIRSHPEEYVLLDVRELDEREIGSIEPSMHIPMNEVPNRLSEIPKDKKLIVYCHHGNRSMMVASYLHGAGYRDLSNLEGGIDAWSRQVDRSVRRYS